MVAINRNKITIYTIGHSVVGMGEFLGVLNDNGIKTLVDIRSRPYSKCVPQFNIYNIEAELKKVGIEYVFMGGSLGGRPHDSSCYDKNGRVVYNYIVTKKWYKGAIVRLVGIATTNKTVIMCCEEGPFVCHRHHLITQSLLQKGVGVIHIRLGGALEPVEKLRNIQTTLET